MGKKRRSLDDIEIPPWRFISFTDAHLSSRTLDRVLETLRRVRELAKHYEARVVFNGDFWDARGVLAVRQVVPLLEELDRWRAEGIEAVFVPGNHDQVSMDGRLHGIRILDPFPNIFVATERLIWPESRLAFIPWREDPTEQQEMFTSLPGDGWTIFAHAEVEGATTNYAHVAPGRVLLSQIKQKARACYCGHYHKRQKLGDRTWYIGSPFQHTFGEMHDPPKGVALIRQESIEPEWIEFDDMPKHHRATMGVPFDISAIRTQDIVEVYHARHEAGGEDLTAFLDAIPAEDVRPLPLKVDEEEGAPAFALSLDEAITAYVGLLEAEAAKAGTDLPIPADDLAALGRAVLSELPEARVLHPMSPEVRILGVQAVDFCALRGTIDLDLEGRGLMLLKGPVGVGKTALVDAITWGLYGATSPRKAGSHTSTFRGDEVIHDDAAECSVTVRLRFRDGREVSITRAKKRGAGARAAVEGVAAPDGVKDTQDVIDRAVGLTHDLWRTCVSLGQGAVGNFVTDADTARKGLLSTAFGLDACPAAQKLVRSRLKPIGVQVDRSRMDAAAEKRALEMLEAQDFEAQAADWDRTHESAMSGARTRGEQAAQAIAAIDAQITGEAEWLERKKQHDAALEQHMAALTAIGSPAQAADLQKAIGAAHAEKALVERDLGMAKNDLAILEKGREGNPRMACPTCGQPMPAADAERYVAEKTHEMSRAQRSIATFDQRIENLEAQLATVSRGGEEQRSALKTAIAQSRETLDKIGEALSTFTRLRSSRDEHTRILEYSREEWKRLEAQSNPWRAKAAEHQAKIAEVRAKIEELTEDVAQLENQAAALAFWEEAFGAKGIPVLVLRTVLHELETHANRFLVQILAGRIAIRLVMTGDSLGIQFLETVDGVQRERRYEQLSGGQRRCVELAFSPFALSEMVFSRAGVRVPLLIVDELTTHLGQEEKPLVCEVLRRLDRGTVLVIDHDAAVQAEFDVVYQLQRAPDSTVLGRVAA